MHAESTKGKVTFSLVSPAFRTDHTCEPAYATRCDPFFAVLTSDRFTQIRVMFLEHSPHSQKCSSRLLPVFGHNELINLAIAQVVEFPPAVRLGAVADHHIPRCSFSYAS
jgi:hypothetical protein